MTENMGRDTSESKNKKEEQTEEQIRADIEKQSKKVPLFKKIIIYITSFKWQAWSIIFLSFIVPTLLSLFFILLIEESNNFIDVFTGTPLEEVIISKEVLLTYYRDFWNFYLLIFNFAWIPMFLGLEPITIVSKLGGTHTDILTTTFIFMFFNFFVFYLFSYFTMKKFKISKKGNNEVFELTKKLREKYSQAHTMKSIKEKEIFENELNNIKKKIMTNLKLEIKKTKEDPNKIYFLSGPIFKIMTDRIDSMSAGMVAGLTNEYWQKKIALKQRITSWEEVLEFLFVWQFNDTQLDYMNKLNVINTPKYGIDRIKFCNFGKENEPNQYDLKTQKESCMKLMCVSAYFKNYPKHTFLSFFESHGIVYDALETKLIVNASNWISAIENDKYPGILPMSLLLPRVNTLENSTKLAKLVYETLGELTSKMPLLQNQAIEAKGFDPNSPFIQSYIVVETHIIESVIQFIELLFFNISVDYNQTIRKYIKRKPTLVNAWPQPLKNKIEEVQNKKEFSSEEKKEIEKMIRQTLKQRIEGITKDEITSSISSPIDAEIQVARLKRFISIDMFLNFYRDFLNISNILFFYPEEGKNFKENDLIGDIHNQLKLQFKTYYEYYYDYLYIEENIRVIPKK